MPANVPTSAAPIRPPSDLRGLIQRAHGVDDAEHRGDDAERWQTVGDRLKRVNRLVAIMRERFDFLVHQRLDFVGPGVADDDEAAIVADERHQILVGQELREGLEDRPIRSGCRSALRLRRATWPLSSRISACSTLSTSR